MSYGGRVGGVDEVIAMLVRDNPGERALVTDVVRGVLDENSSRAPISPVSLRHEAGLRLEGSSCVLGEPAERCGR